MAKLPVSKQAPTAHALIHLVNFIVPSGRRLAIPRLAGNLQRNNAERIGCLFLFNIVEKASTCVILRGLST
jgi:hypothetical protein